MRTTFKIETPDDVTMTLKVSMTLRQWRELNAQLDSKHPSWKLSSAISEMVLQATKAFYANDDLQDDIGIDA